MSGAHPTVDSEQISRTFSRLMMLGKTKSALQYLFRKADEGVLWRNGDIEELYKECKYLQARMSGSHSTMDSEQISCTFSRLMMLGKTKAALQYLFRKADEGVLKLDDHILSTNGDWSCTVRKVLQELHPAGKDPDQESLLSSSYQSFLPTIPSSLKL